MNVCNLSCRSRYSSHGNVTCGKGDGRNHGTKPEGKPLHRLADKEASESNFFAKGRNDNLTEEHRYPIEGQKSARPSHNVVNKRSAKKQMTHDQRQNGARNRESPEKRTAFPEVAPKGTEAKTGFVMLRFLDGLHNKEECIENDTPFLQRLLQKRLYHTQSRNAPFIRNNRTD